MIKRVTVMSLLFVMIFAPLAFAAPASVYIATGGSLGTYYQIGGGIAAAVSKSGHITAVVETGSAAIANTNLVAEGETEVAFTQADVTAWAYNGQMMFEGNALRGLRTIAALYPETIQLVLSKSAGIKTLSDIKGKKVGVGAPGSGTEGDVRSIFQSAALKYDDISAEFLDFGATSNRFKDNQIDAGFIVAGVPTSALMDLTTARDADIFNFDKDTLDKIIEENPFFVANVIPANTYGGIDYDVNTPSVMSLLVTNEDVPEDVIYNFTKGLFENIEDVQNSHAMAKNISLETATEGLTAPLHSGAAKYYKEVGINVD
jgi:TRAP transporter TAXI family solute receptor